MSLRKGLPALLAIAVVGLAGCLPKPEEPIEWLEREDAVIVQMKTVESAESELAQRLAVPDFTLYGDGTLIYSTDGAGQTHEKVVDVVGNTTLNGNELNTNNCEPNLNAGFNELCSVYEDTEFDPSQPAFYYARILEDPTCRWSTYACKTAGVDPFLSESECMVKAADANAQAVADGEIEPGDTPFDNCCLNETNDAFLSRTIQERAWTSPIWYEPKS